MGIFDKAKKRIRHCEIQAGNDSVLADIFKTTTPFTSGSVFELIPTSWQIESSLINKIIELTSMLNESSRFLINAILWDSERLKAFCVGPSSINGHHNSKYGNILHTIETAKTVLSLCEKHTLVDKDMALLCALLHDIGKASEYLSVNGRNILSNQGKLLGHRLTIIQWLSEVKGKYKLPMSNDRFTVILHNLTATPGLPEWSGYRGPQTLESHLVSLADRFSGIHDLYKRNMPDSGWGRYHKHLKCTPYRAEEN